MMDPLEPLRHVRDKRHLDAELGGDLPLVDMVREAVGDDIVSQIGDVVLRGGLRAGAGVAAHAEDGGLPREMGQEGRDADLRGGGVAAWIGDAGCLRDCGARDQFGETVCPGWIEAVVG